MSSRGGSSTYAGSGHSGGGHTNKSALAQKSAPGSNQRSSNTHDHHSTTTPAKPVGSRLLKELGSFFTSPVAYLRGEIHEDRSFQPGRPRTTRNSSINRTSSKSSDDDEENETELEEEDDDSMSVDYEEKSSRHHPPHPRRGTGGGTGGGGGSSSAVFQLHQSSHHAINTNQNNKGKANQVPVKSSANTQRSTNTTSTTGPRPSTTSHVPLLRPSTLAAAATTSSPPSSKSITFNGNQFVDKFGNPRHPIVQESKTQTIDLTKDRSDKNGKWTNQTKPSASAHMPLSPKLQSSSTSPALKSSATSSRKPIPTPISLKQTKVITTAANSGTPATSSTATAAAAASASALKNSRTPTMRPLTAPINSPLFRSTFESLRASPPPFNFPSSALASGASSAAAAASSSDESKPSACVLPPHPHYPSPSMNVYMGRTGASSSSANHTPRKRAPTHIEEYHHNPSFHSASLGTPLVHVLNYSHPVPAVPNYVHFRQRFKPKSAITAMKAKKAKNLQAALNAATLPTSSSSTTAAASAATSGIDPLGRKKVTSASTTSPSSTSSSSSTGGRGKKRDASALASSSRPKYQDLFRSNLVRHACIQPADGDWLWESLQQRTTFTSIDTYEQACQVAKEARESKDNMDVDDGHGSSSSSSIASPPTAFSPFAHTLPISQSSIMPYYKFQDCDEDYLRLFTDLKAFVRYHRLRGLIVPPISKKHSKSKQSSQNEIPDDILKKLYELKNGSVDDDEDMDVSDRPPSRTLRERPSSTTSDSSSTPEPTTLFMRLLQDTDLIPTSLTLPCAVLYAHQPELLSIPVSTQLMSAKYASVLPLAFHDLVQMKPKQIVFQPAPSSSASSSGRTSAEEKWLDKNSQLLPRSHQHLVRLFYHHVKLPPANSSSSLAASSTASSSSAATISPLLDLHYHFNLTSFTSSLLHYLYQKQDCHKFVMPVDPLTDRLLTYHRDVIKHPMSFYDIDMRLVCGYYDSILEVLSDLWQCFSNTLLYHSKPFHRHRNESKAEAEDREHQTLLTRDMVDQVQKIWKDIRGFVDKYYALFMSYQPISGMAPSPRTVHSCIQSTLTQLRLWMDEIISREVQTAKILWIAKREVQFTSGKHQQLKLPVPPLADWKQFDESTLLQPTQVSSAADTSDDDSDDDDSHSRPSKRSKFSRPDSPLRPTRAHPIGGMSFEFDSSDFTFPPSHHSRSHGGRHARNLPPALVRKLARRGGKVPYGWDARWFYYAKVQ